ncbi:MAG TPA: 3-deoxy-7-phosphoheptulonate synthase [Candidatus Angelobacter sp.]|jgi:3-deoxy-7-phosphoheptulonate synthase|nr:3-deoxy-7-phosphoheptulonate synthase [Candidatus Angelobacter sp.]
MTTAPLLPAAARPHAHHAVRIGDVLFGGGAVPVIAGPCAVEPTYPEQVGAIAAAGASVLRGCVHKPRTRPDSFQGLGAEGYPLLDAARAATGLPVLSEPLEVGDVERLGPHCDAFLIGARSMQNTPLLREVGRALHPVILKRGLAATYDEWLGAAEYVLAGGNDQLILCERGIRTFETATRNTLDVAAIPVLRERTGLPVIVDPSHAAGQRAWVAPLAMAAIAAGADGLIVECHPDPAASWSDAAQAISPEQLRAIVDAVEFLSAATRSAELGSLSDCREGIDQVDAAIARLLERRAGLVAAAQSHKGERPRRDGEREARIARRVAARAPRLGPAGAEVVMQAIIESCLAAAGEMEAAHR